MIFLDSNDIPDPNTLPFASDEAHTAEKLYLAFVLGLVTPPAL